MAHNRYACLYDLNNYFKKKDLLGGLTEIEQQQLRKNIGIIDYTGEGGQTKPLELAYSTLINYISRKALITGARYIITDFQTIYSSNTYNETGKKITWGATINPSPTFRLIATAITADRLDPRVVIEGKDWTVEYDVTSETLEDGVSTKGKITYLRDSNNNSAFYDFKSIRFRRDNESGLQSGDYYTFSDITDGVITDSTELHNTKNNVIKHGSINNVFLGDTYNNIIETDCVNNTFIKGCHDTILKWNSVNNVFYEPVCYTEGSIYNKTFKAGDTSLAMTITKTIQKVNEATIISYLDPITYAYQIIII